jgi:hypothetical protein
VDGPGLQDLFRDEQWSLAVMCPALLRGRTQPLALMGSADRGRIGWPGSNATEAVRFLSIRRVTDCAITCFHSRKLAARSFPRALTSVQGRLQLADLFLLPGALA